MIGNNASITIIVISGVIALVLSIWCAVSIGLDVEVSATAGWSWCVSTVIFVFMIVAVGITCSKPYLQDNTPYLTRYIHSIEDNNLTTGKGYYRRIQIDTDLYYQFLYKDSSGYISDKVKANNTLVIEDTSTPRVEYYNKRQKWFIFEFVEPTCRIYIPPTSIQQKYNIDLK